ncbi:hypothetical protein P0Y67_21155 [Photobacterium sp. SP02]|uniref:hypothetical protein n=1 Tax=Photobacterium sp. SP02 TaxID=3032280 RepID=UPI003144E6FB
MLKIPENEPPKPILFCHRWDCRKKEVSLSLISNPQEPHGAEFIFTQMPFEELVNDHDECEEIEHAEMVDESFEEAKKIE